MKFCSSCGKKVSTTREDDEIESCSICGKVLAFPGLRANPLFINGEVVPRLLSKIPSENISRERLYEKVQFQPDKLHGEDDMISNYFDDSNDFFNIDDAEAYHHLSNSTFESYEQAARETAAAAAKEAWEENFKNCPEELQAAAKEREAAIENSKREGNINE
ncbi:hypothetical protein NC653_031000 [Populus alba x Populus x berolinensis]|uniref:Uncharacterized protein n=1 Tax=Populus alba x Populus x berolinensis TaxID=444605 RepID=A0AAD6LXP5_9ROSI|nr:hypothetical protein NC653_031000 [Populus alba x Populus x berolinensis]